MCICNIYINKSHWNKWAKVKKRFFFPFQECMRPVRQTCFFLFSFIIQLFFPVLLVAVKDHAKGQNCWNTVGADKINVLCSQLKEHTLVCSHAVKKIIYLSQPIWSQARRKHVRYILDLGWSHQTKICQSRSFFI